MQFQSNNIKKGASQLILSDGIKLTGQISCLESCTMQGQNAALATTGLSVFESSIGKNTNL